LLLASKQLVVDFNHTTPATQCPGTGASARAMLRLRNECSEVSNSNIACEACCIPAASWGVVRGKHSPQPLLGILGLRVLRSVNGCWYQPLTQLHSNPNSSSASAGSARAGAGVLGYSLASNSRAAAEGRESQW